MTAQKNNLPIGVFDSGVGGLTVLHAMRELLPRERLLYLGDTARVPYGTKSPKSIVRYAVQAAGFLRGQGIKMLVVACNTASAVALKELQEKLAPLPVVGVIQPGATAAVESGRGGQYLVMATEATVRLGAYRKAITALDPAARIVEQPCEMMVALAEEGWTEGDIPEAIIRRYVDGPLSRMNPAEPRSIILGCTHFPLLKDAIRRVAGPDVQLVDSASTTAGTVVRLLDELGLRSPRVGSQPLKLLATDGPGRFARVGSLFLSEDVNESDIELVDL
jgi:glutamate racemase